MSTAAVKSYEGQYVAVLPFCRRSSTPAHPPAVRGTRKERLENDSEQRKQVELEHGVRQALQLLGARVVTQPLDLRVTVWVVPPLLGRADMLACLQMRSQGCLVVTPQHVYACILHRNRWVDPAASPLYNVHPTGGIERIAGKLSFAMHGYKGGEDEEQEVRAMAAIAGAQCGQLSDGTTHVVAKRGYARSSPDDLPTVSRAWLASCLSKWSVSRLPTRKRITAVAPPDGAIQQQEEPNKRRRRTQAIVLSSPEHSGSDSEVDGSRAKTSRMNGRGTDRAEDERVSDDEDDDAPIALLMRHDRRGTTSNDAPAVRALNVFDDEERRLGGDLQEHSWSISDGVSSEKGDGEEEASMRTPSYPAEIDVDDEDETAMDGDDDDNKPLSVLIQNVRRRQGSKSIQAKNTVTGRGCKSIGAPEYETATISGGKGTGGKQKEAPEAIRARKSKGRSETWYGPYRTAPEEEVCKLCQQQGEQLVEGPLLQFGRKGAKHGVYGVHYYCAMWCPQVYEDDNGRLQNLAKEIDRGSKFKCAHCGKKGAALGCAYPPCKKCYHYGCGKLAGCSFVGKPDWILACSQDHFEKFRELSKGNSKMTGRVEQQQQQNTQEVDISREKCALCHRDGHSMISGHLEKHGSSRRGLAARQKQRADLFVHRRCALWCPEVYQDHKGALRNVQKAVASASKLKCAHCNRTGASIACKAPSCGKIYHLECAFENKCIVDEKRYSLFCNEKCMQLAEGDSANAQGDARAERPTLTTELNMPQPQQQEEAASLNPVEGTGAEDVGQGENAINEVPDSEDEDAV